MTSAVDRLLDNNVAYAASAHDASAAPSAATEVAVVTCMDARLDLYRLLGLREGQAHVIRNAGGAVTDDAIRSLVVSQRLTGTREVLLIHHSDCKMLMLDEHDLHARIEADTGIRPPFALESFADLEQETRQSIARVKASPFLPHRDNVRGFLYEIESGRLREVH